MDNAHQLASEYLAFRCTIDLFKNTPAAITKQSPCSQTIPTFVCSADEIDTSIAKRFQDLSGKKLGILLSGGMDSACLAAYMPAKSDAFTFRFEGGKYQSEELARAESYAAYWGLSLHYVDISWENTILPYIDQLMASKGAPVHSIEPQILQATILAKEMGIDCMIVGESADLIFGGMDGLLSQDWDVPGIAKRYTFCPPEKVLKEPTDINWLYEQYKQKGTTKIDLLRFMDEIFSVESSASYTNAFKVGGMEYCDPYAHMQMGIELDLDRVRKGDSKYLVRELFLKKYGYAAPNKTPMPRPVDFYFQNWEGPKHPIFKEKLDMTLFTGNQKWQLWCLERFLINNNL